MTILRMPQLLLIAALAACAAAARTTQPAAANDYSLDVRKDAASGTFLLSLTSRSTRPLCLGRDNWPSRVGRLHMGSQIAQVVVGSQSYPADDDNFGYCMGRGCTIRIEPGRSLRGHIAFSEFVGWNWRETLEQARLVFSVSPRTCR